VSLAKHIGRSNFDQVKAGFETIWEFCFPDVVACGWSGDASSWWFGVFAFKFFETRDIRVGAGDIGD
jgi:hypothetical protein